jgi:predicted Rossmann fold nucleotide-binding protein DprA/Smf involved in DNA uptake
VAVRTAVTTVTNDERAILLLCASLGRGASGPRPLSGIGYDRLAEWLRTSGARPGHLLSDTGDVIAALERSELADLVPVLRELLSAQLALALRMESWGRVGGWVVTRGSADYPRQLQRLGARRPPVLFGLGVRTLLGKRSIAIVGSRDAPDRDIDFSTGMGAAIASSGLSVVSGAARGVDWAAMSGALAAEGTAVGVVSDSLADVPTISTWRNALLAGNLCMVSAVDPESRFTAGNAMARNKIIYGLAERAIVIRASHGTGGTWSGATEAIRSGFCPVHVRGHPGGDAMKAAEELRRRGALELPDLTAAACVRAILGELTRPAEPEIRPTLWD